MKQRIILGDTQAIFRRGAARVLGAEADFEVVAQCATEAELREAMERAPRAVVVFQAAMVADVAEIIARAEDGGGKTVLITDRGIKLSVAMTRRAACVLGRSVAGAELVPCLRHVMAGKRYVSGQRLTVAGALDKTGVRILRDLTPKEVQIMALVVDGAKNREIATLLGTKEQVIKNYLRSIYDKTGVSDRLELAIFVAHHAALADAADEARKDLA